MIRQSSIESPKTKVEVGEIDTRSPFQSVKDAVNRFGEVASLEKKSSIKRASFSSEKLMALANESEAHLARKELNELKLQIRNAETTKAQALSELEEARKTVEDLSYQLKIVTQSKVSVANDTEAAKTQAKQLAESSSGSGAGIDGAWKQELDAARELYVGVVRELDAAKQEQRKLRQDCDAFVEAKVAAFKQVAEAGLATKANMERANELSKETSAVQESIRQVKLASSQAQEDETTVYPGENVQQQTLGTTLEEGQEKMKKLLALKQGFDPEVVGNLEAQLSDMETEIGTLQKEVENARASELDSVSSITLVLDGAKELLQKVTEEGSSLQSLVESLKQEMERVKNEHFEVKEKEAEMDYMAGNLQVQLCNGKSELEACIREDICTRGASDEQICTLHRLTSEIESARQEAEESKRKAAGLKEEAEATRVAVVAAEKNLKAAVEEAEKAEAAEAMALHQIKILSETSNAAGTSTSESGAKITISTDEFESLSRKVEESDTVAEIEVAAAKARLEAMKGSENEVLKRLEASEKEFSDMKAATEEALKEAGIAEADKRAVEEELRGRRDRNQKKAIEMASHILAETEMSSRLSPHGYRFQRRPRPPESAIEAGKWEKERVFSVAKRVLLPSLSEIFQRRKYQVEGAGAAPNLVGEKFV